MEAKEALIGGERGYEFYERIAPQLSEYITDRGFAAFEIGHDQAQIVKELLGRESFKVNIYKDYSGQDRVAIAWKY